MMEKFRRFQYNEFGDFVDNRFKRIRRMITGERVKLRRKRLSDAKQDYKWQVDPELVKLDAAEMLQMSFEHYYREYAFELSYPCANRHEFAVDTLDGEHVGNCVYYNVDLAKKKVEIGIMIGNRKYWDQGYGEDALKLLIDYVFNKYSLEEIYLTTLNWNERAHRCFNKCGFEKKDVVERDGHKFILMSLDRSKWESLQRERGKETSQIN
jgi:[ribosomal protein S5]-alanine N-acetyltransferase